MLIVLRKWKMARSLKQNKKINPGLKGNFSPENDFFKISGKNFQRQDDQVKWEDMGYLLNQLRSDLTRSGHRPHDRDRLKTDKSN